MPCHLGTTTGHDSVPSRERARDHFLTDAAARKRNPQRTTPMKTSEIWRASYGVGVTVS